MTAKRKNDARTNYRKMADDELRAAMLAITNACSALTKLQRQRQRDGQYGRCGGAIKQLERAYQIVRKAHKAADTAEVYIDPKTGLYEIR